LGCKMEPSPYTPSEPPRVFVGREQERTLLRDRLARVIAYGEMMGPLSVVTGARGLGKTSLLADVEERAARDGFVVAWVSGIKHQRFLPDVVDRVTRSLERADVLGADSRVPRDRQGSGCRGQPRRRKGVRHGRTRRGQ